MSVVADNVHILEPLSRVKEVMALVAVVVHETPKRDVRWRCQSVVPKALGTIAPASLSSMQHIN